MRVLVNGVRLYLDVEGAQLVPDGPRMRSRPVIVALHGGPGADHSTLKPALSPLADIAQVVYLDHRGHGRSDDGDPERWTLPQLADDVRSFCDTLDIERPIVYGQSFGATVAMMYAVRYPEHPLALMLVAATAVGHELTVERTAAAFRRLGGDRVAEVYLRDLEHPSEESHEEWLRVCLPHLSRSPNPADAMAEMCARMVARPAINLHLRTETGTLDLRPVLPRVRCATLLLVGEDDLETPPEDADEIADSIGHERARVVRVRDAAHTVFRDQAPAAHRAARRFLDEVCAGRG